MFDEAGNLLAVGVVPDCGDDGLSLGFGARKLHSFSKKLFWNINCRFHASNMPLLGIPVKTTSISGLQHISFGNIGDYS